MASTYTARKSTIPSNFIAKNYEIHLNSSLEELFASRQSLRHPHPSSFTSNFQELMLCKADPPLEVIWVYAALKFNELNTPKDETLSQILIIKDLFQLIISNSASCGPIKAIVLVAPVLYKLHYFMIDVMDSQLRSKKGGKVNRETENLIDSVLGYLSVCCDGLERHCDHSEGLMRPIEELIGLWSADNAVQNKNVEAVRVFFPFLSGDTVKRITVEGCGMADFAGFVVGEAILLKLCWKLQEGDFGEKIQNEIKYWLVGSLTGLQSSYLYVTFVCMLLESPMPIASNMNSKNEDVAKEVLFKALLLVEYSFLTPERLSQLPPKHEKYLIFTKLMAANEAIEFFRENGNHAKAIPYLNAFTNSCLPLQIIKSVRKEIGHDFNTSCPIGSSPRAFLRWILDIENRGIKIFDDDLLKYRAKVIFENSKQEFEELTSVGCQDKLDSSLFYIDNNGQEEHGTENDETASRSMIAAFMADSHKPESSERVRKYKTRKDKTRKRVKFVSLDLSESSSLSEDQSADPSKHGSDSQSEVENLSPDDGSEG